MRILVLSNKCPPDYDGGYELSAFQVAGALRGRGYDVQLVTSHYRPTFKGPKDTDPAWVHRIFEYKEWPNLTQKGFAQFVEDARRVADLTNIGLANSRALGQYLATNRIDLAYCFGLHGIGLATHYPLVQHKVPLLWHAGNYLIAQDLELRSLFKRKRIAHRFAMHFRSREAMRMIMTGDYSHIAFLSESMKREFIAMGYEPPHSYVVPRGIDFPLSENVDEPRKPVLLMASRIGPEKGYGVVLDACGLLADEMKGKEWELRIAGSGDPTYLEHLRDKAKRLGIESRVHFIGMLKRKEVLDEMRQACAFVSASLWEEPFGRTNIEALACGAALIAADTGAIREIVGDSGCALIYEKNNAKGLAGALKEVLESESLRKELAEKGITRIEQSFTMDRILDMTEHVFEQVMRDYGKPFERPNGARG